MQSQGYVVSTSSIGEFSYSSGSSDAGPSIPRTHGNCQTHGSGDALAYGPTTGRKTYKMSKSKREVVWPPHLEAALISGLEKYLPTTKKDTIQLLRFPKRNRFIAQHILQTTDRSRTAKQVGSRLQQLRETCKDQYILDLIENKNFRRRGSPSIYRTGHAIKNISVGNLSSTHTSSSDATTPSPSSNTFSFTESSSERNSSSPALPSTFWTTVSISLSELGYSYNSNSGLPNPSFTVDLDECGLSDASHNDAHVSTFSRRFELQTLHPANQFIPTVVFSSSKLTPTTRYRCLSRVYCDNELVYTDAQESILLKICPSDFGPGLFKTTLVPHYWSYIIEDYNKYTITHEIFEVPSSSSLVTGAFFEDAIFSIEYRLEGFSRQPTSYFTEEPVNAPPHLSHLIPGSQHLAFDCDYQEFPHLQFDFSEACILPHSPLLFYTSGMNGYHSDLYTNPSQVFATGSGLFTSDAM
ncbi:hypothetical protein B0H34DRAFT_797084 [Crassisporium funariophilum]|nr:hypothetical protein B0H34DRAFT_797084 [Crassisporium funariophilum]